MPVRSQIQLDGVPIRAEVSVDGWTLDVTTGTGPAPKSGDIAIKGKEILIGATRARYFATAKICPVAGIGFYPCIGDEVIVAVTRATPCPAVFLFNPKELSFSKFAEYRTGPPVAGECWAAATVRAKGVLPLSGVLLTSSSERDAAGPTGAATATRLF